MHLPSNVNRPNLRALSSNSRHEANEHSRGSPKMDVFCASSKRNLRALPFEEHTRAVTGTAYLDTLEECLLPTSNEMLFNQDRRFPHFHKEVTDI